MKGLINSIFIFFFFVALLFSTSCYTSRIGCTKKDERQSRKHFTKSVNKCPTEAARQSLIFFPIQESDSSWTNFVKGTDTITKIVTENDTIYIDDKVYLTKYVNRYSTIRDTIFKGVQKSKVDTRQILSLKADIDQLNADKADLATKATKYKSERNIYRLFGLGLFAIIAVIFGIRYVIPKVLNRL